MFCKFCGQKMLNTEHFCTSCGKKYVPEVEVSQGGCIIIPDNTYALLAYYLGIFSVIGGITSIPAIVFGILGLRYERKHPKARGGIHSCVGIIGGSLMLVVYLLAFIFINIL